MTAYYCDLAQPYADSANVGDTTGNPHKGVGGLLAAIYGIGTADKLAAGDILYVKGSGSIQLVLRVGYDGSGGGQEAPGAAVTFTAGGVTVATGTLVYDDNDGLGAGELYLEITSGWPFDNDTTNLGGGHTVLGGAAVTPHCVPISTTWPENNLLACNSGTTAAEIAIVGVDSDWSIPAPADYTDRANATLNANNEQIPDVVLVTGGKDITAWSRGDLVSDDGAGGTDWAGYVLEVNKGGTAKIWVRLTLGQVENVDSGDTMTNETAADSTTLAADADAVDLAQCVNVIQRSVADGWRLANMTLQGASAVGVTAGSSAVDRWCFDHVHITTCGSHGIDGYRDGYPTFLFCEIDTCGGAGLYFSGAYAVIVGCIFHDMTSYGVYTYYHSTIYRCLFYDNGNDDIFMAYANLHVIGNTFDGNTGGSGVFVNTNISDLRAIWNRFTRANQYGIEQNSAGFFSNRQDHNLTYLNGVAATKNIAAGPNNIAAAADGYTNRAGKNYTLTSSAEGRRVLKALNSLNTLYMTMGQPPTDTGGGGGGGGSLVDGGLVR
uniref:Putative pectate lyase n=1 Tax=viral metagenome TaxID=1070528 RepID=A0A6M3IL06_9ZZZZ